MQRSEGESRLGRRPGRRCHHYVPLVGPRRGSLEQCGLPDPGLAAHDKRAPAPPDPVDQVVEPGQLAVSADKRGDTRVSAGASPVHLASSAKIQLPPSMDD
jgi:hypothetical protein